MRIILLCLLAFPAYAQSTTMTASITTISTYADSTKEEIAPGLVIQTREEVTDGITTLWTDF